MAVNRLVQQIKDPGRGAGLAVIEVHAIMPQELRAGVPRTKVLTILKRTGAAVRDALRPTTETWEEHEVDFAYKYYYSGPRDANARVEIGPVGDRESVDIWNYLNWGTQERWAVMSRNWQSKTKPGRIRPGPGRGYVRLKGKGQMQAEGLGSYPGIEAREWTSHPDVINKAGIATMNWETIRALDSYAKFDMWKGRPQVRAMGYPTVKP